MKNIILFTLFIFILGCSSQMEQSGNISIRTPDLLLTPMKSIVGNSGNPIDPTTLDQARFRYDIFVESNSKRIYFGQLKKSETATISVPSGVPLNFKVGAYYAVNSTSMDETYNSYIVTGEVNDIYVMPGESKFITIKLNLKIPKIVESYFNDNFGISTVSGGVMGSDGNPYFSILPLTAGATAGAIEKYMQYNVTFNDIGAGLGFPLIDRGIVSRVSYSPMGNNYWYIQSNGVRESANGYNTFGALAPDFSSYSSLLSNVFSVKTVYANDIQQRYYYFLNYGIGYLVFGFNIPDAGWSNVANIDFNDYNYLYEKEPFLLDVEQDELITGTRFLKIQDRYSGSRQWLFFATKMGLFYVHEQALQYFAQGDRNRGINEFKKIISIPNPYNPKENVLVTKVKVYNNTVYLGSKQGVYYIDKNSAEWKKFVYDSVGEFTYYSLGSIKKVKEFIYEEPVVNMDLTYIGKDQILSIATPKRIWFKNLANNKIDMVTVWDGLPFVPVTKFTNSRKLNDIEFKTHDTAPINFTLWDSTNSRFWIGTDYGLSSVNLDELNLN